MCDDSVRKTDPNTTDPIRTDPIVGDPPKPDPDSGDVAEEVTVIDATGRTWAGWVIRTDSVLVYATDVELPLQVERRDRRDSYQVLAIRRRPTGEPPCSGLRLPAGSIPVDPPRLPPIPLNPGPPEPGEGIPNASGLCWLIPWWC